MRTKDPQGKEGGKQLALLYVTNGIIFEKLKSDVTHIYRISESTNKTTEKYQDKIAYCHCWKLLWSSEYIYEYGESTTTWTFRNALKNINRKTYHEDTYKCKIKLFCRV